MTAARAQRRKPPERVEMDVGMDVGTVQLGTLSFQAHVTEIFETVENELLSVDGRQAGGMGVTEAGVKARCVIPPAYVRNSSCRR